MRAPDYIAPIVAYRLWQWDVSGLKSLNGVPWVAGQALAARCGVMRHGKFVGLPAHVAHIVPKADCRCGVYASKRLDTLRSMRFWDCGVRGEVLLWGAVVEHEHGWRAQFAYPKTLYVPCDALPVTLAEIQSCLKMLTTYRVDIFVADLKTNIPLWANDSGYDAAGLDYLIERSKRYYARRRQERTLNKGDRVAILGRGIAVVEQVNDTHVLVLLWNWTALRIRRKGIVWDKLNMRWEASGSGVDFSHARYLTQ